MVQTALKTGIGLFALLALSACANQERATRMADTGKKCHHYETLVCDKFAGETHNCTCEKGDSLRDMVDAYALPDY